MPIGMEATVSNQIPLSMVQILALEKCTILMGLSLTVFQLWPFEIWAADSSEAQDPHLHAIPWQEVIGVWSR